MISVLNCLTRNPRIASLNPDRRPNYSVSSSSLVLKEYQPLLGIAIAGLEFRPGKVKESHGASYKKREITNVATDFVIQSSRL